MEYGEKTLKKRERALHITALVGGIVLMLLFVRSIMGSFALPKAYNIISSLMPLVLLPFIILFGAVYGPGLKRQPRGFIAFFIAGLLLRSAAMLTGELMSDDIYYRQVPDALLPLGRWLMAPCFLYMAWALKRRRPAFALFCLLSAAWLILYHSPFYDLVPLLVRNAPALNQNYYIWGVPPKLELLLFGLALMSLGLGGLLSDGAVKKPEYEQ